MNTLAKILLHTSVLLATSTCVFAGGVPESKSMPVEASELARHVVWEQGRPTVARFVPSVLLQDATQTPFQEGSDSLQALRHQISIIRAERDAGKQQRCTSSPYRGFATESAPDGETLEEKISSQDFAALGTVKELVPGWFLSQVRTMVYISVEHILWCAGGKDYPIRKVNIGDVVSTTLAMGSMDIDDVTLCTSTPKGFEIPEVGDQVLILGSPRVEDPYLVGHSALLFLVDDGHVLPQPYENFQWELRSIESLEAVYGTDVHLSCGGEK
jgi:hypothetical protein